MTRIFPSLISANTLELKSQIELLEPHCDGFHIDIMDNQFVPNLTWGPLVVNPIAKLSKKPIWVHLMVADNLSLLKRFSLPASSIVSFHVEATNNLQEIIDYITQKDWIASLAIKPKTAFSTISTFLPRIKHVLIMSVEPGFSGQQFIESSIKKVQELTKLRKTHNYTFTIGIDGGVNQSNIKAAIAAGADDLAVASAVFAQNQPIAALAQLKQAGI